MTPTSAPPPDSGTRTGSGPGPGRPSRARRAVAAYLAACAILALLLGSQTALHRWGSDVWHHAAVVRTVAQDPLDPAHPVVPGDAPHPFIVPPSMLAAVIVAATGTGPFDALALVAGLNLALFLAGIWFFVRAVSHRGPWVPLWALGFCLFLWGPSPWGYSGFLHLNQIGRSLPYPSTFAMGAALLCLAAYASWIATGKVSRLAAGALLAPLVVLSHPVASIFLCTVMAALLLRHIRRPTAWIGASAAGLASLAATLSWPFYPYWELVGATELFDASNRALYDAPFLRTLPLLPGLAVVIRRLRRDRRDPLGWSVLALAAVYAAGFPLERWSLGRAMSPLAFLVQVVLADWVVEHGRSLRNVLAAPAHRRLLARAGVASGIALLVANMAPGVARTLPPALLPDSLAGDPRLAPVDQVSSFLARWLGPGDVVLARPKIGWIVPAYGGKVLAPALPQAFVDTSAMEDAVRRFFAPETGPAARRAIVRRYAARWILVDVQDPRTSEILDALGEIADPAAGEAGLRLLSIEPGTAERRSVRPAPTERGAEIPCARRPSDALEPAGFRKPSRESPS